ncbi:MAG: hypothetical protein FD167_3909, partial [bacterium]
MIYKESFQKVMKKHKLSLLLVLLVFGLLLGLSKTSASRETVKEIKEI